VTRVGWLLLILLSGCGTQLVDPCAHQSATCLAVQIEGSSAVSRLSAAEVRVSGDTIAVDQTVSLQKNLSSSELPVALAITFPTLAAQTTVGVDVIGLLSGSPAGEGTISATMTPGQHTTVHVRLDSQIELADGGAADMASSDLAGYVPLTVQLAGSGTGTVTATGLSCAGNTCSGMYPPHTMLTIGAMPDGNATFTGWSGAGCTGTGSCLVTLDLPTTVTATFDWKFVPSHVPANAYVTNAANLSGVTAVDTHNLTINGAAPPPNIAFAVFNGNAVMSVAQWTIDQPIIVTGDAPLIVIAAGPVVMTNNGSISVAASGSTSGPGGGAACSAAGAGQSMPSNQGSGGGGNYGGGATAGGGVAGGAYGASITSFCGGAVGGTGDFVNNVDVTCNGHGIGGGGGGAVQISSAVSLTLHGTINAAGGGGGGGAAHANPPPQLGSCSAQAGGGGSGGEIFLEAPMILVDGGTLSGGLFANGGGGGGPKPSSGISNGGMDGINGNVAATGGSGATTSDYGGNGAFSPDGISLTAATAPSPAMSGGGGGGVGRIWLRTRGAAPSTTGSALSPAPMIDQTL
jgi:hypothetical protein